MPRVPTYQSQLGATRATAATVESAATYMPFVRETQRTGAMIEARGQQLLQEYDQTRAYAAFNELRDESRVKVEELLQREGALAQGVQGEYEEWNKQARSKIIKDGLTTFSQRDLFGKLSDQRRASDLDHLANHEATQHRIYKGEVIKGLANVTERDIRGAAYDDAKMDGMIGDYFAAIDGLFPGHDTTADKLAAVQTFRVSAMDELINTNPQYASKKIEEWRDNLGDKYSPLKKRIEEQTKKDELTNALGFMQNRFGSNYEAAAHYASQESKFKEWGGSFEKSTQLNSYFNSLASQRDRDEDHAITRHNRAVAKNDFKFWQDVNDPDQNKPRPDGHKMAREGRISQEAYLAWVNKKDSVQSDNTAYYIEVYQRTLQGFDTRKEILDGNAKGFLSDASTKALGKMYYDDSQKSAYKDIKDAIDPGDAERSADRALKFYDANKKLEARILAGEEPRKAARIVINEYVEGLRRSYSTLPIYTENMKGNRKDPDQVRAAMQIVASKMAQTQDAATFKKYKDEYETLKKMLERAREQVWVDDTLEKRRQEEKKENQKALPGGVY